MSDNFIYSYKPFALSERFLEKYNNVEPDWGFNGLGKFVYMRTYSRLKSNGENETWQETLTRVVNGVYNMQKKWIMGNRLVWDERKAQLSAQEMYDRMFNMKFLPPGRGLWAMGSTITEERGLFAALNNCFAGQERFLTSSGYKTFSETVGTEQTILTTGGEWKTVPVKSFGEQEIYELVLTRQGVQKTIRTTDNHRWFYKTQSDVNNSKGWRVGTTLELQPNSRLRYNFGQKVKNASPHGIVAGFTFGDGTLGRIDLQKGKDEDILPYLSDFRKIEHENFYAVYDIPEHYKELPDKSWDRKYLYGWLMGYFAADGSVGKNGQVTITSAKRENLEFYKEILALCGIGTYSLLKDSSTSTNYSPERELYKLSLIPSTIPDNFFILSKHKANFDSDKILRYWNVVSIRKTFETEEVFCVQVPEKHSFTLEDNILTMNCAFISTENIKDELAEPFCFLMDASMLGVGVGFDTKGSGKIQVQKPKQKETVYIIPDSREGWVESLKLLLNSYFQGTNVVVFDYSQIRKAGELIKGFGGISSGSQPLEELHIAVRNTLDKNVDNPISMRTITDIMNLIGKAVIAGNVRRTAEIVIGDPNDGEFLDLKNYEINPDRMDYGWTSNNSVFAEIGMDYSNAVERTKLNGEPGYAWLDNMQAFSRMNGEPDNKDHRAVGSNPCAEQTLESWELCTLVETFPTRHETKEDFLRTLKFAYLYAKTVTLGQTHWPNTNRVMLRNRRIGCSVTGIAQFIAREGIEKLRTWLVDGYNTIQKWDEIYSDWFAIPRSIKTTSIKPSGSISLLAGVTPGLHYPESRFYIRRIRVAKNSPLLQPVIDAGFHVEETVGDSSSMVIEFPVDAGEGVRTTNEVSMWEQLALAAFLQKYWSDNQVSATITFNKNEEDMLLPALNYYQYQLKGISFLPKLEMGAFPQMPYETISEGKYKDMLSKISSIKTNSIGLDSVGEKYCNNDTCTI